MITLAQLARKLFDLEYIVPMMIGKDKKHTATDGSYPYIKIWNDIICIRMDDVMKYEITFKELPDRIIHICDPDLSNKPDREIASLREISTGNQIIYRANDTLPEWLYKYMKTIFNLS